MGNFTANINYLFEAFFKYEQGIMPFNGTLGEQPNKIMEVFSVIDYRKTIKQKEADKEAQAKAKRK